MKTGKNKTSFILLTFLLIIIFVSCASGKSAYIARENEEIYGSWINNEYNGTDVPAKLVYHTEGTWAWYMTEFSTKIAYSDTCRIKEKWTDDKGIVWYKVIREMQRVSWEAIHHLLVKISDAGVIMESSFKTSGEFPTIVDPKDLRVSNYTIYYLQ